MKKDPGRTALVIMQGLDVSIEVGPLREHLAASLHGTGVLPIRPGGLFRGDVAASGGLRYAGDGLRQGAFGHRHPSVGLRKRFPIDPLVLAGIGEDPLSSKHLDDFVGVVLEGGLGLCAGLHTVPARGRGFKARRGETTRFDSHLLPDGISRRFRIGGGRAPGNGAVE